MRIAAFALSAADGVGRRGRGVRRRSRQLQDSQVLRRRMDRHHRDDLDRRRDPQGSRLHPEDHGSLRARHLRLDEEQGHRCVPRQLGAIDGERSQALYRGQVGRRDRRQSARRREIHACRSAIYLRQGPQGFRRHREVQGLAEGQDLRHRARQRRQPARSSTSSRATSSA